MSVCQVGGLRGKELEGVTWGGGWWGVGDYHFFCLFLAEFRGGVTGRLWLTPP